MNDLEVPRFNIGEAPKDVQEEFKSFLQRAERSPAHIGKKRIICSEPSKLFFATGISREYFSYDHERYEFFPRASLSFGKDDSVYLSSYYEDRVSNDTVVLSKDGSFRIEMRGGMSGLECSFDEDGAALDLRLYKLFTKSSEQLEDPVDMEDRIEIEDLIHVSEESLSHLIETGESPELGEDEYIIGDYSFVKTKEGLIIERYENGIISQRINIPKRIEALSQKIRLKELREVLESPYELPSGGDKWRYIDIPSVTGVSLINLVDPLRRRLADSSIDDLEDL